MRIGALLFVAIGLLSAAACSASTSSDLACSAGGGTCVANSNLLGCGEEISGLPCDQGYTCCSLTAGSSGSGSGSSSSDAATSSSDAAPAAAGDAAAASH
jgi:hypothetical protein